MVAPRNYVRTCRFCPTAGRSISGFIPIEERYDASPIPDNITVRVSGSSVSGVKADVA